jgi:hypothetical protein
VAPEITASEVAMPPAVDLFDPLFLEDPYPTGGSAASGRALAVHCFAARQLAEPVGHHPAAPGRAPGASRSPRRPGGPGPSAGAFRRSAATAAPNARPHARPDRRSGPELAALGRARVCDVEAGTALAGCGFHVTPTEVFEPLTPGELTGEPGDGRRHLVGVVRGAGGRYLGMGEDRVQQRDHRIASRAGAPSC